MAGSWAREPLLHFVAIGALIFVVDRALASRDGGSAAQERIVVDEAFVAALRARHAERTGRAPDAGEEDALVRDFVCEEALFREARAAGLDEGDAIVRRRLVQKMEFLLAGSVQVPEPDDATLEAWMGAHAEALRTPARVTLEHVFFTRDRRGERAEEDARAALALLRAEPDRADATALGDPFVRGNALGPASEAQIAASIGPAFARAVMDRSVGAWEGPIASTFGAHLVRVTRRTEARLPALEEVRERVTTAWMEEQRAARVEEEITRIVGRYAVDRE